MLVTADTGAMTLTFRTSGVAVTAERLGHKRYWRADSGPAPGEAVTGAL